MRCAVACLALLVVLGFAGCADDGGGDGSFAEQADAICTGAETEIGRIARPQNPSDPLQLALFLERAVPVARAQNQQLKQLERPPEQRTQINQLIGALEAEVDAAERMLRAARRDNRPEIQRALQESGLASAQTQQLVEGLGLEVCGGGA